MYWSGSRNAWNGPRSTWNGLKWIQKYLKWQKRLRVKAGVKVRVRHYIYTIHYTLYIIPISLYINSYIKTEDNECSDPRNKANVLNDFFGTFGQKPRGTLNFFWVGMFPKVASMELSFFEKLGGVGNKKNVKFVSWELKFWPKIRLKLQNFSKNWKWGSTWVVHWW